MLSVKSTNSLPSSICYNITKQPKHGRLKLSPVVDSSSVASSVNDPFSFPPLVTTFKTSDVESGRLSYTHDGSETELDEFSFIAFDTSSRLGSLSTPSSSSFKFRGRFSIQVNLTNDHAPVRVIDKEFHVVINGEKSLTDLDLKYSDADIDCRPEDIMFNRRAIPNAAIFDAKTGDEVFKFSQKDLNDHRLKFRHLGGNASTSRINLWVTDGQFYATGVLVVKASLPFVRVSLNTGLIGKYKEAAVISLKHLNIESNLDLTPPVEGEENPLPEEMEKSSDDDVDDDKALGEKGMNFKRVTINTSSNNNESSREAARKRDAVVVADDGLFDMNSDRERTGSLLHESSAGLSEEDEKRTSGRWTLVEFKIISGPKRGRLVKRRVGKRGKIKKEETGKKKPKAMKAKELFDRKNFENETRTKKKNDKEDEEDPQEEEDAGEFIEIRDSFTLFDLKLKCILYIQEEDREGSSSSGRDTSSTETSFQDYFSFKVHVKDVWSERLDSFAIQVFPKEYFSPLIVDRNESISVDEGSFKSISGQTNLKVSQVVSPAANITFFITTFPRFGSIRMASTPTIPPPSNQSIFVFTQEDLNADQVVYCHEKSIKSPDSFIDYFTFDVSNGVTHLRNQVFSIEIISSDIMIETVPWIQSLFVNEGGIVPFKLMNLIDIPSPYYKKFVDEFLISKLPLHGSLILDFE